MKHFDDLPRDDALLTAAARSVLPDCRCLRRSTRLIDLDLSSTDFMAMLAALEDLSQATLADQEVARCRTLGDMLDSLRRCPGSVETPFGLDGDADQPADAGRNGHGRSMAELYPPHSSPGGSAASPGPHDAAQRQAG